MKAILMVSVLGLFLCGCDFNSMSRFMYGEVYVNRANINKIEIGMTKVEVLEIMGKPYTKEADQQQEWWLYQTETQGSVPNERVPSEYTPIVFDKEGKVIGWGRHMY